MEGRPSDIGFPSLYLKNNYKKEMKVIILKGLPASGKSTWAKDYVSKNPNTVRTNKDDIREMLGVKEWSKGLESIADKTEKASIIAALNEGWDVIVDDTNFNERRVSGIKAMIKKFQSDSKKYKNLDTNIDIEEKYFNTDLETCLERNSKRTGKARVPDNVIKDMYNNYVKNNDNDA